MEIGSENNRSPDNKNLYLSDLSKEMQTDPNDSILSNSFDSENNYEKLIPARILLGYNTLGFKIVPLGADSKVPVMKSTNEIYANPCFWTPEKIEQKETDFLFLLITLKEIKSSSSFLYHCLAIARTLRIDLFKLVCMTSSYIAISSASIPRTSEYPRNWN